MYFEISVHLLVDLLQEAFHTPSSTDSDRTSDREAHNVSVVLFFCTLREIALNWLIEHICWAQKIPKPILGRLRADSNTHSLRMNNLLPSLVGKKWKALIEEETQTSELDYAEMDEFVRKAVEARNNFMHEGKHWALIAILLKAASIIFGRSSTSMWHSTIGMYIHVTMPQMPPNHAMDSDTSQAPLVLACARHRERWASHHDGKRGRGSPVMHCVVKRASLAVLLSVSLLFAVGQAARAAELESRDTSFQSAGYRLKGTLTGPVGRSPVAGVLIIPGSGPVDRDGTSRVAPSLPPVYRQWAERLGETGFVVLRYDKRFLTYPDLDIPAFDQEAQITDALAAVAFLRSLPGLAPLRIFIIGHSEGGTLAPLVAERTSAVAGVAIINAVQFSVDELLVAQLQARPDVPRSTVEDVRRHLTDIRGGSFPTGDLLLGAGSNYWAQWMTYSRSAPETLSRLSMPLLLVQCLNDETLPGDTLARNVAILRAVVSTKKNAQLRELRNHDHLGILPGERHSSSEFIRIVVDWLSHENRAAQPGAPADAASPPRR